MEGDRDPLGWRGGKWDVLRDRVVRNILRPEEGIIHKRNLTYPNNCIIWTCDSSTPPNQNSWFSPPKSLPPPIFLISLNGTILLFFTQTRNLESALTSLSHTHSTFLRCKCHLLRASSTGLHIFKKHNCCWHCFILLHSTYHYLHYIIDLLVFIFFHWNVCFIRQICLFIQRSISRA